MLFGSFGFWNSDYYLVENFGTGFGFTHNKTLGKVVYNSDVSKCSFPYDTEDCLKMKIGASFVASGRQPHIQIFGKWKKFCALT